MATWAKRVRVAIDWALQAAFPRDLVHLRTATTERVSRAHYRPGEYVFRPGDAASSFDVVERGEVEILREGEGAGGSDVVAVLGPGDFFGELALLEERARSAAVRELLGAEPVVVARGEASVSAAAALREHALASVPVVGSRAAPRVEGEVRAEALLAWLLEHAPAGGAPAPA